MKQFDLEKAKAGAPICTRDGHRARLLAPDIKANDNLPIAAAFFCEDGAERIALFTEAGTFLDSEEANEHDLFMAPEKYEGWANIYKSDVKGIRVGRSMCYESKEEALKHASFNDNPSYLGTVKIEWEE